MEYYKKISSLDSFLRSLDPALIRYHTPVVKWKTKSRHICYQESAFDILSDFTRVQPKVHRINNYYRVRAIHLRNILVRSIVN